jgi:hypothetical protein
MGVARAAMKLHPLFFGIQDEARKSIVAGPLVPVEALELGPVLRAVETAIFLRNVEGPIHVEDFDNLLSYCFRHAIVDVLYEP